MISRKLTAVLALAASANVFAQADNFSGFSVGLNTGFETLNSKVVTDTSTPATTAASFGNSQTPFDLNLSYLFAIGSNGTLGLGVNYDLTKTKSIKSSDNAGANSIENTLSNHYSINIEPGYAYSDSFLGYFKLSYHSAKQKLADNTPATLIDKKSSGMGYGFGAKYLVDKNLFLNLEIQKYSLNKIDATVNGTNASIQTSATLGTVGVGYKF